MNPKYADSLITIKNTKNNQVPKHPSSTVGVALEEVNACYNEMRELRKIVQNDQLP